jgi:hypothetical protein
MPKAMYVTDEIAFKIVAGNQGHKIVVLEWAGHVLAPAVTGCYDEPVPAEYVPEYLDTLENWLVVHRP